MKRGQVAIFAIIGLVILISGTLFIFVNKRSGSKELITDDTVQLKQYIDSCLMKVGEQALYYIGDHGGYYHLDSVRHTNGKLPIAYWLYKGNDYSLNADKISKQLSYYVEDNINKCLSLNTKNIQPKTPKVETKIVSNGVQFVLNYPIRIVSDGKNQMVEKFIATIPIDMRSVLSDADMIIKMHKAFDSAVEVNILFGLESNITVYKPGENDFIYNLKTTKMQPYQFNFACSFADVDEKVNHAPKFTNTGEFPEVLYIDEPYRFQFKAADEDKDKLVFHILPSDIELNNETGEMVFTPTQLGEQAIEVEVTDGNDYDTATITVTVAQEGEE